MKPNVIKIACVVLPIIGACLSLATNWFEDKKLDDKVAEKVAEAFKNQK
jgi:hypothetical protein